jgi:hypothetical protein
MPEKKFYNIGPVWKNKKKIFFLNFAVFYISENSESRLILKYIFLTSPKMAKLSITLFYCNVAS